jgi:transcriptional antiterminator RfaH
MRSGLSEAHGDGVDCLVTGGEADTARWYLVQSHPHAEEKARVNLGRQGFECFLPAQRRTVRHARKVKSVMAPLFPRYLFVRLDLNRDRWLSVRSTFGVSSLFMIREAPVPVPRGVVEDLLAGLDGDGAVRLDRGLSPGQDVRVLDGPFTDLVGVLERLDDNGRVRVLLQIMGSRIAVRMDSRALAPAV